MPSAQPTALERSVHRLARRVRLQRGLNTAVVGGTAGLLGVAVALALTRAGMLPSPALHWAEGCAAAVAAGGLLIGTLRPLAPLPVAQLIDRTHRFDSRVSSALEFAAQPTRTAFEDAALQDAAGLVPQVQSARALPFRRPPYLGWCAALIALLAGLWTFPHRPRAATPPSTQSVSTQTAWLHPDELEAFARESERMAHRGEHTDETRPLAESFNQLVEELADQQLSRDEALRRLATLERKMRASSPAEMAHLDRSLTRLGEDLRRARLAEPTSRALRNRDAQSAERSLRALATKMRSSNAGPKPDVNRAELERLRRALRQAAQRRPDRALQQAREKSQRLLQRQKKGGLSEAQRRLLQRRRRELQRLERQQQETAALRRELERLRRDLGNAAEDLNRRAQNDAARSLERGAESLNRMARRQTTEQQRRELREMVRQLREALRRGGGRRGQDGQRQPGSGGRQRMDRFVLRAQGQNPGDGTPLLMPGGRGKQPSRGRGQNGRGGGSATKSGAQGKQGKRGKQALTLNPGGRGGNAQLELPGGRTRTSTTPGNPAPGGGPEPGAGHDSTRLENPTQLAGTRRNVRVEGEQGVGTSRSDVILGAADRGFAGRNYQRVFRDYKDHAEEVLERDEVPPGYRFYVRRYFQLIRPRGNGVSRPRSGESREAERTDR